MEQKISKKNTPGSMKKDSDEQGGSKKKTVSAGTKPPPVKSSGMPRVSVPPPVPSRGSMPPKVPSASSEKTAHAPPVPRRSVVPKPAATDAGTAPTLIQIESEDSFLSEAVQIEPEDSLLSEAVQIEPEDSSLSDTSLSPPSKPEKPRKTTKSASVPKPKPTSKDAKKSKKAPTKATSATMEIPSELLISVDMGKGAFLPADEPKPARPAPAAIGEVLKRIAAAKSKKGVSGPEGNMEERAAAVVAACEAEISSNTDKARAARLHFEIAQCCELYLNDESKALQHYQKSVELRPDFLPASHGARRLLTLQKNYPAAIRLLDSEIELEGDARHKALLHCVKGRIYEDFLHQQTKARQCYVKAHELSPGSPEVIEALNQVEQKAQNWPASAQLLTQAANAVTSDSKYRAALIAEHARLLDARTKDAAGATEAYARALEMNPNVHGVKAPLKRLLYTQARWQELTALWEREIAQFKDSQTQVSALLHIGRLYADKLEDRDKAVDALERAHRIAPSDIFILESLIEHYENADMPERLIDALKRLSTVLPSDKGRVALLYRIGELFEKQIGDAEQAVSRYEEALEIFPAYVPALRAVAGLYERLGRWEALAAVHLKEASGTDDVARRADAHVRAAEIFEYRLNRPRDAASHHAAALSLSPGLELSFKALTRLYTQSGNCKQLIELYETAVDRAEDEDTAFTYLFKIGSIYEDVLRRPDLAVDVYRRIQKRSARHLGAIHAIQRTAEASGRFKDLSDALKTESEIVKEPRRHVELLLAVARVADEKLQDTEAALTWYKKVLETDAAYPPALEGIGRLYRKLGQWPALLDIYAKELKLAETAERKAALLTQMAEVCAYHIGNDDKAIKYYQKAAALEPDNSLIAHALCRRLARKGDFDTLAGVLQDETDRAADAESKARLCVRMGEIHEMNRDDQASASSAYQAAVDAAPSCRPGLDGLLRVGAVLGRWAESADCLIKEADVALESEAAVENLLQAGMILNDRLNDADRSISTLESVLAKDGGNLAALLVLAPLLRDQGKDARQKLMEVHSRLAAATADPREKISLLKELARLAEAQGDAATRVKALSEVSAIDPRDFTVTAQLEQAAVAGKDCSLSAEADLLAASESPVAEIAALYLGRLGRAMESTAPLEAVEAYSTASAFDAHGFFALYEMGHIGEKLGNPDTQIQALKKQADWTESGRNAADILVRCADIRLRLKRDLNGAAADLSAALHRCPEHEEAAERVTALLTEADQLETLIEILARAAEMTRDGAKKAEYWGKAAALLSEGRNDINGAINALNRMLSAKPTHVPAMLQLADLYSRNRQWEDALKILERAAKQRPQRKIAAEIYLQSARIADAHLGDSAAVLANIEALLQLDPSNVEALTMLCETQYKIGRLEAALNAAEKLLKAADAPNDRAEALLCIGRVRVQKNLKKSAAKSFREAVASAGPARMAPPEYLSMLGKEEPWEEYLAALLEYQKVAAEAPDGKSDLVKVVSEIARVQHEGLRQPSAAVATLEQAVSALGNPVQLRFELAERLAAAGQMHRAEAELVRLTAEAPMQPEIWRLLADVLRTDGKTAEATVASAPLAVIGGGAVSEHGSSILPSANVGVGLFGKARLVDMTPRIPGADSMMGLLSMLSDALAKVYPPALERYGLSSRDRLADTHPLHLESKLPAAAFGVQGYDLYLSEACTEIKVEPTHPVSIIVPERLNRGDRANRLFALARVFAYIAIEQHSVLKMGPEEARLVMAAVTRKPSPAKAAGVDAESLERRAKRIFKAVSWRARKGVEEAASSWALTPGLDFEQCLIALETGATRAAAIFCQSPAAAAAELDVVMPDEDARSVVIRNLLAFWATDAAFSLRREAGLI